MKDRVDLTNRLWDLEKILAWYEKKIYDGHTVTRKEDGWLLTVKARSARGEFLVCHTHGRDTQEAFYHFLLGILNKPGNKWKPDAYRRKK